MREIKFRAKQINDNNWISGYGVIIGDGFCAIPYTIRGNTHDWKLTTITCDINTLGQYTGLKDKNGKEIYEGDIVGAWSAGGHLPNGIIKWGEGIAGFFIMPPKCNAVWHLVGNYENKESLEVLGNIHDNPELIKEEEK